MQLPDDSRIREAVRVAMKSLVGRERTSAEIERLLASKGFGPDEAAHAVTILRENRLLDDSRAVRDHLEARSGKRAVGRMRLEAELGARGAQADAVEELLAARTDEDELSAMAEALQARRWSHGDRVRAGRFLASRGFDGELIEAALDRHFGER
jgi:SOS response regulatory protein OraA/RecX